MYSLEDRIYFDGAAAAAVTLADNNNNISTNTENTDTSSNTDNSSTNTNSSNSNSTSDSGTAKDTSSAPTKDTSSTTATKDTSAATNSDSFATSGKVDIDALIASILNTDTAASETTHTTLVVSTAVENADALATEAQEHNITVVTYDPAKETLQQLFKDIQTALNGEKASSINFVTTDNSAAGFSLVSDSTITESNLTLDSNVSAFFTETASILTDGGRISVSGDSSLSSSDAGPLKTALADATGHDVSFIDALSGSTTTDSSTGEQINIYFIDRNVDDIGHIIANIPDNATLIELGEGDGLDAITRIINQYNNIDSIHIISQANYAQIMIGNDVITANNISEYQAVFSSWNDNLSADADILFYGCDIAKDASGQAVVNQISAWTGADVAASTDVTGNNGGNWALEYSAGTIETASISIANYDHHLETYVVTSTTDNGTGAAGTLSWAINQSNSTAAVDDTITFNVSSGDTVTISATMPTITDTVTINGTNTDSGNNITITVTTPGTSTYRVFSVNASGETITISNMTIKGGDISVNGDVTAGYGGAIYIADGTVILDGVTISSSKAYFGGAIYNIGTMNLSNCTFGVSGDSDYSDANIANYGGAIYNASTLNLTGGNNFYYNEAISTSSSCTSPGGGAIYSLDGTVNISGTNTFDHNRALIYWNSESYETAGGNLYVSAGGGAINLVGNDSLSITGDGTTTFSNNSALIYLNNSRVASDFNIFMNISGGAIYSESVASVSDSSSATLFTDNNVYFTIINSDIDADCGDIDINACGGAIYSGSATEFSGASVTFSGNRAYNGETNTSTFQCSVLNFNLEGAAIYLTNSMNFNGASASFSDNSVECINPVLPGVVTNLLGGAIYNNGGPLNFSGTITFDANTATSGSAIYVASGGTMNISSASTNITGTSSANADIYLAASDSVFSVQENSSLTYCTVTCNGKIYITSGKTLTMSTASKFESGSGTIYGASESTVLPGNLTFASDSASDSYIPGGYINTLLINSSGTKTAAGNINISNGLTINSGITFAVGTYTATIAGASDINGTLTISTGTFDANGAFDATGGTVTFTGSGNLKLASTVTSLGNFTVSTSTVIYDGGNQTVLAGSYYTLSFYGSTSGSTKTFANGTTKVATEISLSDTITLTGSSSDAVTVQVTTPGSTVSRVFYILAPGGKTITIENMTIKGGDISSLALSGGGIYLHAGTLYLDSVVITGSKAYNAGGISSLGTLRLENCTVSSCTATNDAGGIYSASSLTMENCTIDSCTATNEAGGIYLSASSTLKNCTISNNTASSYGTAISMNNCSLVMFNCTISNNPGSNGAIFATDTSVLTITDSTIAGNKSSFGIYIQNFNSDTSLYLTNSIVAYNYYYSDDTEYSYNDIYSLFGGDTIYGDYNITSFTGWSGGTGNVAYTYTNGKGASLFASYTEISANKIYAPVLADNGGSTYTVALAGDSIAAGTGCLTGTYNSGTQYAFSSDGGTTWYKVEDGSTTVTGVTQITTDQRGVSISGTPSRGSYYLAPSYYYRSNVDGSGNWSIVTNWEVSTDQTTWTTATVAPTASNSIGITIQAGDTITANSSISIDQTTIESTGAIVVANGVTLTVADGTGTDLTANGTLTVSGTGVLLVASGASADVNSTFTVNGTLSFDDSSGSDNGTLNVSSSSITITTLTAGSGTIAYDGAAQNIVSATYYNLTLSGSGTKTASGTISVGNNLTVASGVTLALGTYTATVTGTSDINGTLTISTGTFDANGAFDATGGTVTFTGSGNLKLASTVTSLGNFTASTSTVTYDGGNQTVLAANYYTLSFSGSTSGSTKTFANGTTSVATQISLTDAITLTGSSKDNVTVQVTTPGSSNCRVFYVDASGKTVDIENMTIKGGKVTVGSGGAMVINNGTVNLDGVTVSGSSAQSGGAGYVVASATLNVINSTIDSNATIIQVGVDCYGGAFYNMGTLNIQNSTLSNNTAKLGGAIFNASAGGVGIVSISLSSQIINNSSTGSGGAIYNEKTLTIDSSTLSGNTAGTDGGAIISWNDTTISNSTINNNTASAGNGGFIYFGNGALAISGSNTFTGNAASANGGAIYISGGTATLTGATFGASGDTTYASSNTADKGGAIYIQSNYTIGIANTNFYYNYAVNDGGAIYNAGTINFAAASTANSASFIGNKTTDSNGNGGGAIYNTGNANIGVSGDTKTVTLTFTANTTVSDDGGGGAIYNSGTITMAAAYTGSSISFTKNQTSDGFGGALCISGGTVTLSNATFGKSGDTTYENIAFSGGAVYISGGTFTLTTTLGSNYFYSNSAGYSGGAVYISGGTFTAAGVTFDQNKAPEGGAVAVTGGTFTVTGSDTITFSGNMATSYDGGAIELTDTASSTMNYSSFTGSLLFTGNTAIDNGGAIYVSHGSVTIKNATFGVNGDTAYASANTADYGGAVAVTGGTITCDGNVKFYFNEASTYGGAVYLSAWSTRTITMDSVTYLGNQATGDSGGAVYIEGSNLTVYLTNSTFGAVTDTADIYKYGNKATDGGAIYIYSGTVYLTTDSFLYNYATGSGGAIYVYSSDPSLVVTSNLKFTAATTDNTITFTGNSALTSGSAIYNDCIIYFGNSGDTKNVTLNITGGSHDFYTTVDAGIYVYAPTVISGISGTSAVVTTAISSSFSVYENLTFNYTAATIRGLINIQSGKTLEVSTASTLTGSGELSGSGTLKYTSNSNSDILKGSIGTLNIASSAVETMKGALEITSSLANTGTLSIDGNTLTLNGSYTDNGGTIKGGATSDLIIAGNGGNITLSAITDGLENLTLNRAAATVTLSSDLTIYGTLDLTAGYLDVYSHNLTFDAAASVANASSSSFILESGGGSVIKYFDSSNTSFTFALGSLSASTYTYSPFTITFASGTFSSGYVSAAVYAAKEPNVTTTSYIKRYWDISSNGITDYSATVNGTYAATDVTGTESLLYGEHYASSTWTKLNAVNTATHSFTGTVSHFSNFTAFGQYTPPPTPTPVNNNTTPETNIDQQPQEPQNNMNNNLPPANDVFLQVQNLMPQTITRSEMTLHSTTWNDLSSRITNNVVPNGEWGVEILSSFESDDNNPVTIDTHEDSILGATGTDDIIGIAGNYDYAPMSLWSSKFDKHPLFKTNVDKLLDVLFAV